MATTVENRRCSCGERYRTKTKKGRDTRQCPGCGKDNSEQQGK